MIIETIKEELMKKDNKYNKRIKVFSGMAEWGKGSGFLLECNDDSIYYIGPVNHNGPKNEAFVHSYFKHRCDETYNRHLSAISAYKKSLNEEDKKAAAIVVVGMNDPIGKKIAEELFTESQIMAAENKYIPSLDTLADKGWISECLMEVDMMSAMSLRFIKDLPVVVINFGVVNVYQA